LKICRENASFSKLWEEQAVLYMETTSDHISPKPTTVPCLDSHGSSLHCHVLCP